MTPLQNQNPFPGAKKKKNMCISTAISWICIGINIPKIYISSLKLNSSHMKMDAWNMIVSCWGPAYFSEANR